MNCKNYEPVEAHTSCDGCESNRPKSVRPCGVCFNAIFGPTRHNWTPAQPEPVKGCGSCQYDLINCLLKVGKCVGFDKWKPKEPKRVPEPPAPNDIPKPTPEQLKAIGKMLDGDEPTWCDSDDRIWDKGKFVIIPHYEEGQALPFRNLIGELR